ncbi:MAG: T9SS type A sorting domain-containing protein, partial [bacterium]
AVPGLRAQEAVLSASGNTTGSNGSVTWSVGQVAFMAPAGTTGSVTEVVQQPYEIQSLPGIEDETGIRLEYRLYPNPVSARVWLEIEDITGRQLRYQLYSASGTLLQTSKIGDKILSIPMETLDAGTYLLTVSENDKVVKTFKILKK